MEPTPPPPPSASPPARPVAAPREQEQSIKARKQLLFEKDEASGTEQAAGPTKPFVEYLRTTPPAPLPTVAKATLWTAAVIVVLLFLAALIKR